ncbi:transcriptional regulator [Nocardia nova]|uniref:helix-turn-helix domain-containing protein n=1 Tax=Nocardia nova TaxID=37330 RepID=UPI000CEA3D7D|nr:transcriptional regulator [Nocardia nova]
MDLAASVGTRVRQLREARGISLSELARRSTVGKGTLSELEGGQRNPTLETLYALTTALEVPLSTAFQSIGAGARISGDAVDAILTERFEAPLSVTETYRIRIRAEKRQESPAHTPGTTEHIVIFAGTARVGTLASPVSIGPGAHGSWPADVPHAYQALDEDVEALLLVRYPR